MPPRNRRSHHNLWVKSFLLRDFEEGRKTLEVRVECFTTMNIRPGDTLMFNRKVKCRVVAIRDYSNFESVVRLENCEKIWPGHTADEILRALHAAHKRKIKRVLVFELAKEAA
jgi:ASC-1-like (ASCH) protein